MALIQKGAGNIPQSSCCHAIGSYDICVKEQLNKVYLIKWPVSVY